MVADKDGKLSTQITVQDKVGIDNKTKITLLNDKYDTDTQEDGILTYVKEDNKGTYTVKTTKDTYTKVAKDYSDLLGQKVDILVKTDDNSKVYGIYANEDSSVIATGYVGSLELDGSKKVKLNGTSYKLDSDNNSIAITRTANTDATLITFKSLADKVVKGNVDKNVAASTIKLIDNNGDGKIDTAVYTPVKVGKVTSVSKSAVTVNNGINTVKFEDADIYSGIAKDDYVQFVDETYRSAKDKDSITKLTVASNKVNGVRTQQINQSNKNVEAKAGSTWVKLASDVTIENGSTYDMVIVGDVLLFADETAASSKDILYISGTKNFEKFVGEDKGTVEIRAYFTDGTDKKVTVSKYDGEKLTDSTQEKVAAQALYTYSALSDGTYDIKALDNDSNKAGYDKVDTKDSDAYAKQKINNLSPTDEAVIFVQTKKETKVISGKQLKNWADTITSSNFKSTYALNEKDGINYVGVAMLVDTTFDKNVPGASKDTKYGYLVSDAYSGYMEGEDGKKATYEVWTNEGAKTLYADEATAKSGALAGKVISYSESGKYIDDITVVGTEVAITGFDYKAKGELAFTSTAEVKSNTTTLIKKGAQQITLDEDCVFIGMNDADTAGVENAGMAQVLLANPGDNSTSSNETVLTNAYIVVGGDDNKVMAVIFDADKNELDNAKEIYKKSGDVYVAPAAPTYTAAFSAKAATSGTDVTGKADFAISKKSGLVNGEEITVTVTKKSGESSKVFGAGTYTLGVTGASNVVKTTTKNEGSLVFTIIVGSSDIVINNLSKS